MLAIGLAFVAAIGFGSSAVFARAGMRGIHPLTTAFISVVISFIPAAIIAISFALEDIQALPLIALLAFLAHGALNFIGGRTQNHISISLIGASRSSPFVGSAAMFASIFAVIILGEYLHPLVAAGTAAVVIGLIVSSADHLISESWRLDKKSIIGYATGLGAAASYGGSTLVAKSLSESYGSPFLIAAAAMFFGMLLLAPMGGRGAIRAISTARTGLIFIIFCGLASALGVISLFTALSMSDVVIVTPIASISPLVTLVLAHFFLNKLEQVTKWIVFGTGLAVLGIVMVIIGSTL